VLRTNLFLVLTLLSGASFAQSSDPAAASPVVYDNTAPTDCTNADGTPCLSYSDAQSGDYGVDYSGDGYPAYDPTTYYSPPFYLGVSLWPWGYWGWGYPYYGYVGWGYGYGWPYWGYAGWGCCGYWGHYYAWSGDHWHGGHWHDGHDGWHDGHGSNGGGWHDHGSYPGPYRYAGNGQYSHGGTNSMQANTTRMNDRATAAATFNRSAGESMNGANFAHGGTASSAQRGALPSSSYFSTAQRMASGNVRMPGSLTSARAATNFNGTSVRGAAYGPNAQHTMATRGGEPYHVAQMPSRSYATASHGNAPAARSYAYGSHGYAQSNGYGPSRSYAGPNGYGGHGALPYHVPSYTGRSYGSYPSGGSYAHGPVGGGHAPSGGGSSHGGGGSAGGGGSHGGGGGHH
jgi:hypothetical protein